MIKRNDKKQDGIIVKYFPSFPWKINFRKGNTQETVNWKETTRTRGQ